MAKSVIAHYWHFTPLLVRLSIGKLSSKKWALLWAILALDRALTHAGRVLDSVELAQLVPTLWNAYLAYCVWAEQALQALFLFLGF